MTKDFGTKNILIKVDIESETVGEFDEEVVYKSVEIMELDDNYEIKLAQNHHLTEVYPHFTFYELGCS